jgi:CIC family chloride channel protein
MKSQPSILRDFTVDRRVWLLSAVALVVGTGAAGLAVALLRCIALATNLFYYHRISSQTVSPAGSPLGLAMPFVPVVGGLIVGFMARYGSDKIRGHGIPEAIEAILLGGARVEPRIAILKPVSAAIAIGSGGPFGAEGPIIMTGGAFGSLIAQWMKLTDAERTTLLVAGAAAGMSATFAAPLAATLLAVELLLFELRPRSLVPVAIASAVAAVLRVYWLGPGPLFATSAGSAAQTGFSSIAAVGIGLFIGLASASLSRMMYGFEDLFGHLPLHWMWWPAIGGVGIGVGGIFFPRGLGVGYDNIAEILRGNAPLTLLIAGRDPGGSRPHTDRDAGPVGIGGDGRDAFRCSRRSVDSHCLQPGTYALPSRVVTVDARVYCGACRHVADYAAINSHRKVKPAGLSPDQGVWCGPAGDGKCDGSDV